MVALARLAAVAVVVAAGLVRGAEAQQCSDFVYAYCTAGTTVQGCVPSILGIGVPSAVSTSGFEIVVDNVPTQRMGLIFYGLNSIPQPQPWAVGSASYLCIFYPVNRTGAHSSGGSVGACDGELRVDFNAWRTANPTALGAPFTAGQTLYAQGWFRDAGAAKQTNLSNGLRFVLGPSLPPTPAGMVLLPAGTFLMGSNAASGAPYFGDSTSQPEHQVTISYCFWMGETEVTQAKYLSLMGTNPSFFTGANNPVEQVSWLDAQAYCAALTAQQAVLGNVPQGYQYRLPTEAEWEYACRAGTTTEFNVGAHLFCNDAEIIFSNHSNSWCNSPSVPASTVPVGSYAPNAWGLYDMHGNVSEWCLDNWDLYSAGAVTDPFVTGGPYSAYRVIRGGGYSDFSDNCRSAKRTAALPPDLAGEWLGFRVVLAPILVP